MLNKIEGLQMIITEKQIIDLMQVAQLYLRLLENISNVCPENLSACGQHNRVHVANMLQNINEQQSTKLKVIE